MKIEIPHENCNRGAPMGRKSDITSNTVKLYLQKVEMVDDGAYDRGGAYWGIGYNPLYVASDVEQNVMIFVRAGSREQAKEEIRSHNAPKAIFYK